MNRVLLICAMLACAALSAAPAYAVRPDEMLRDPALEARAREVGKELRCLVCRNQSVDDSDADLAHDLRVLVRERIAAGDTNAEALQYIRARYGDYVLLRPPFQADTLLLWGGPALLLLAAAIAALLFYRGRRVAPVPKPLSAEEQRRLRLLLDGGTEPRATKLRGTER
ncbi:MAG: cytochrome c-type biogenesis protein CcmH [Alphaproteobacteria bacterium]|nr:cytochrome c-type biogenesis protein CcmH [Alphaproteobacteria bacterium]